MKNWYELNETGEILKVCLAAVWNFKKIAARAGNPAAAIITGETAEEVAAECWIKATEAIKREPEAAEPGKLGLTIYRAAAAAATAYYRAERAPEAVELDTENASHGTTESPERRAADRDEIQRAAKAAGAGKLLHYIGAGYPVNESATKAGMSRQQARTALKRIRAALETI